MTNDEDGATQRRHPSPSLRGRDVRKSHKSFQTATSTNLPGPGIGSERSFENIPRANKLKVPAIQNALAGLDVYEKHNFQKKRPASFDLGIC